MNNKSKQHTYDELLTMADGLLDGEDDLISAMANLCALIWQTLPDLNWAGFYRVKQGGLVLAPFQGKPACNRIAFGKGVCGSAWAENRVIAVPDVHAFPGHIACDGASRSEIVIPYHNPDGSVAGVLDIDSPRLARFDWIDERSLCALVSRFERQLKQCTD